MQRLFSSHFDSGSSAFWLVGASACAGSQHAGGSTASALRRRAFRDAPDGCDAAVKAPVTIPYPYTNVSTTQTWLAAPRSL